MSAANFEIVRLVRRNYLVIRDVGPWDLVPTVTNDAEAVLQAVVLKGLLQRGERLLYFDSEGNPGEIFVKDGSRFGGFGPWIGEGSK